ncbi:MAG: RNA polymerase sigma factor region1.1 domain-containing protein [Syntrophobacteraceae bacterium]
MIDKNNKPRQSPALSKSATDSLSRLIATGKEKGYLTIDEVNDALPEEIVTACMLDEMMMTFDKMDIEIVDSEQQVRVVRGKVKEAIALEKEEGPEPEPMEKRISLVTPEVGVHLRIHDDHQINKTEKTLFEHALRNMSTQAFDALLTCGVRDVTGLLGLSGEDLSQVWISSSTAAELVAIQQQLRKQIERCKIIIVPNQDTTIEVLSEEQQELNTSQSTYISKTQQDLMIPKELMKTISTKARNILRREKILTCERILQFKERDLKKIPFVGTRTLKEILFLQDQILHQYPKFYYTYKLVHSKSAECNGHAGLTLNASIYQNHSEHSISDPADWSVLSRSMSDVFQIPHPHSCSSIDDVHFTISDLGIASNEMARLQRIVLFPEDPADTLFSISFSYLLCAGINDNTLSLIRDYLARTCGLVNGSQITEQLSDIPIFSDMQTVLFEEFLVPELSRSELVATNASEYPSITWGDIAKVTERSIIIRLGLTIKGLETVHFIWKLKEQALRIRTAIAKGLPAEAYAGFEPLVDAFVQRVVESYQLRKPCKSNLMSSMGNDPHGSKSYRLKRLVTEIERNCIILKGRLGLLDGRKWTLEELGQPENLTRERIRQIEKQLIALLQKPQTLAELYRLWLAVNETLSISGGVCCVAEIAESLRSRWKWPALSSDKSLATLVGLSPNYDVVWTPPIRIVMPHHQCLSCTDIGSTLVKAVENEPDGILTFAKAFSIMGEFCQNRACDKLSTILQFSTGYILFWVDSTKEILADETGLYTQYAWAIKYGKHRTLLVETILLKAGRAMHFTEVHAEINKDLPTHEALVEGRIHGYVQRSPNVLLWDRGTYIHREHISIPLYIIDEIEKDIKLKFKYDIPYLSISGLFQKYKQSLLAKGIPSESALYSCLRESNKHLFSYPEYPYIIKYGNNEHRLPVPLVLEQFILDQGKEMTLEEIKEYAVEKLCINESLLMASHFPNIPNLIRIDKNKYIHLYQLRIQKDDLVPIIEHLSVLIKLSKHVSVKKLFNQKMVTCKLLGITTPMCLFSIIQIFYSDRFNLSRYPSIRLSALVPEVGRHAGVASEVIRYIREKETPCSFAELYQHFVDDMGYEQMSVHNVFYSSNVIIRYSQGVVVHMEALGWADAKQKTLELLASSNLKGRRIAGKLFGLISHLYEFTHDELPELPHKIPWTPTLVGELLSRNGNFRIIGTQRNAFVSVPNSYGIERLDDLVYYILESEYDGAANIDDFISQMREAGILKKTLTNIMLGSNSRVVIDGNVVKLARLHDSVKRT